MMTFESRSIDRGTLKQLVDRRIGQMPNLTEDQVTRLRNVANTTPTFLMGSNSIEYIRRNPEENNVPTDYPDVGCPGVQADLACPALFGLGFDLMVRSELGLNKEDSPNFVAFTVTD